MCYSSPTDPPNTRPSSLHTAIRYTVRLLVARSNQELLPDQLPIAEARLAFLWSQLHLALHHRFPITENQAVKLAERLATRLLQRDCCRRAVWRTVPLAEALGPYPH